MLTLLRVRRIFSSLPVFGMALVGVSLRREWEYPLLIVT